ncbi:hypothetical protein [Methanoculleus bourgensis]|uniref:hypothetical protein n=1 Tax=Methanoculleus bourgensis TaxID=83986 RepID=UPI0022EE3421|nr:hypothetical protein [Methanoculleus bourgensis]GLI47758.1 hypothetical protein MBOURGENBZM_25500 [Methanoculleus bourgensis]
MRGRFPASWMEGMMTAPRTLRYVVTAVKAPAGLVLLVGIILLVSSIPVSAHEEEGVTTLLAPPTFLGNSLALSPDGTTLAFSSRSQVSKEDRYVLCTMKSDGSDVRQIIGMDCIDAISWNPDGTLILFGGLQNGTYQVYTIQPDGKNLVRLTNGNNNALPCGFDPGGTWILYASEKPESRVPASQVSSHDAMQKPVTGRADLFIVDLNGEHAKRIVSEIVTVRRQVVGFPRVHEYYLANAAWLSDTRFAVPVTKSGKTDLYQYDIQGGAWGPITTPGDCTWSAWNPDEQSLAYRSGFDVRVLQIPDGDDRALTSPAGVRGMSYYDYSLAWRPGANAVAYISYGEGWVTDADGTNRIQVPVTVSSAPLTDLVWSPDGRFLYTISDLQIDRIDLNSLIEASRSSQNTIIELSGSSGSYQPSWSPDSTSLAFVQGTFVDDSFSSALLEKTDIFVYDLGNRTKRQLTETGDARFPAWSPDGSEIAYTRMNQISSGIWAMKTDGSDSRVLTPSSDYALNPIWRPDGKAIAYLNGKYLYSPRLSSYPGLHDGTAELVVVDRDGNNRRVILGSLIQGSGGTIQWNARGDAISAFNGTISYMNGSVARSYSLFVSDPAGHSDAFGTRINVYSCDIGDGWSSFEYHKNSIVFIDIQPDTLESLLKRLDSDGGTTTLLSSRISIEKVQCNPGRNQIAFISNGNIWSVDGNGGNKHALADVSDHQGQVITMRWSPDGSRIAYLDSGAVWVVDGDGSNRRQITPYYSIVGSLEWSPDSRWVTFTFAQDAGTGRSYDGYGLIQKGVIVLIDAGVPTQHSEPAGIIMAPGFTGIIALAGLVGGMLIVRWRR